MTNDFKKLETLIVCCKKCPRLVSFRKKIAKEKRKQFINEKYWGKPITGFGDPKARILFVGLGKTFQIWEPTLFEKFKAKAIKKSNLNRASLKWEKKIN